MKGKSLMLVAASLGIGFAAGAHTAVQSLPDVTVFANGSVLKGQVVAEDTHISGHEVVAAVCGGKANISWLDVESFGVPIGRGWITFECAPDQLTSGSAG